MSIVGPRPERPEFVKALSEEDSLLPPPPRRPSRNHRLGADQLQVRRYARGPIAKLEYDLYYIKNMSWSLDTFISFSTQVKAMLLFRGAQ
jgi:lipopolysaccharide/colanic/teichoic acid biosynthesis glycosyltransferase